MRSYGDPCGLARALDIVGERWSLLIVRELLLGPKRFTDLRSGMPSASPNVLAQRLRELEAAEVVAHRKLPPPAGASVYELTPRGRNLEQALLHLSRWGSATPAIRDAGLSNDALMLALKTMFDPERAAGVRITVGLHLGEDAFRVRVADRRIDVERGAGSADADIKTDSGAMRSLVFGRGTIAEAARRGEIALTGKKTALTRFLTLFRRPLAR
ncbi:MAG: winged helix-turn-helix transcriptional regulator [Candidatus Eremiobacteraeota bacterium]|nr:winged helix-turn-helix transcriptional regulator [Candidatus Eremiobacteraeota bacterium]